MATPQLPQVWQHLFHASARKPARRWLGVLTLAALAAIAPAAHAVTKVWNNAGGGNWSTATNWTPNGAPAAGDVVDITLAGTYTVTLDVATDIASFTLGGATGTQTLAIGANTMTFSSPGPSVSTVNANGVVALSGTGWLFMGPAANTTFVLNVDGRLDWSGGRITVANTVGSSATIGAGGQLAMTGAGAKNLDGGANGSFVNNSATASIDAGVFAIAQTGVVNNGSFTVAGTAAINPTLCQVTNNGTITFTGNGSINADRAPILNAGTLRKNGAAGTTQITLDVSTAIFTNTGLVDAQTGTLSFVTVGSGDFIWVVSSGAGNTFNAATGATINHNAPANFAGTAFTGPGSQSLNAGSRTFTLGGTISAQNLNMAVSTFVPNGATLAGTYAWNGATIGAGTGLTIAAGAVVDVNANSTVSCCGASLVQNFGTVNLNGPGVRTLNLGPSPGFWNQAGGVFNVNTTSILNLGSGDEFRNAGTVNLAAGDLNVDAGTGPVQFNNSGTVNTNNWVVFFNAGSGNSYTQTAGTTNLGTSTGAILLVPADPVAINGGSLIGRQTVTGAVTIGAAGTIAPGQSPGSINVNGPYVQNGTFAVELNGTAAGTGYDQLNVTGTVTLNGPLSVSLGFAPAIGTVFTVINNVESAPSGVSNGPALRRGGAKGIATRGNGSVTGTFTGLAEGATLSVGGTNLQVSYAGGTGNDVTLTVVTGAAVATTTAVTGVPNPSVFGQSVTFTATVSGSSPTGTVQFKDGAGNLGAPVALAGGQAQFVTSALAVGGHSITAVYSGDSGNQGSTSPVFTQTVNAAATTTTIVSALPGTLAPGQSVTVTVNVAAVAPGAGTPTGTVDVTDGGSPLCTVTLSGGSGACSAALNTLGTHALTASYVATTSYNASSSAPTNVTVAAAPPATSIATPVPTLRDWVLVALSLLLAAVAAARLRRR